MGTRGEHYSDHIRSAIVKSVAAITCLLAIGTSGAHADPCKLVQIASVELIEASDHTWLVPVQINGSPRYMTFVFSTPQSLIYEPVADELKLYRERLHTNGEMRNGVHAITETGLVSMLSMGAANARDTAIPIAHHPEGDQRSAGVLGLDFIGHFDVELDFKNRKLNLFSPDHCPGKVVYWSWNICAASGIRR